MDKREGAIVVIAEDVHNGDALGNEFVCALASGFIVDAGNDTIDLAIG